LSDHNSTTALDEELAHLEHVCQRAAQALSSSRNVRETISLAEVDVPHHLKAVAALKVPTLGRLARARDMRVEEVVREQLEALSREYSEVVATRELDRLKGVDWSLLRANYPDIYAKALRQANLIIERKRK
jgi:cobyrinic acid a,c-diamide synthase